MNCAASFQLLYHLQYDLDLYTQGQGHLPRSNAENSFPDLDLHILLVGSLTSIFTIFQYHFL